MLVNEKVTVSNVRSSHVRRQRFCVSQAWLLSASRSACEGVGYAPGPVLLEYKLGSIESKS